MEEICSLTFALRGYLHHVFGGKTKYLFFYIPNKSEKKSLLIKKIADILFPLDMTKRHISFYI